MAISRIVKFEIPRYLENLIDIVCINLMNKERINLSLFYSESSSKINDSQEYLI